MPDDLVLFGVASDGSVEQWDGLQTPEGILLRWFHARDLGFPDYGYDLYRSRVPDIPPLVWHIIAPFVSGQTSYNHADEILLGSELGFQFYGTMNNMALVVQPGDRITLTFPDGAWFLSVEPSPQVAGTVTAEIFAGGESRGVRQLASGDPPWTWRTRGIERVELTGNGAVRWIHYGLLNSPRHWTHLVHLCLPVSDPSYPCSPQPTGTDEDEASSRVPPGVDWEARYSTGFGQLHPYLKVLAPRTSVSFPASSDPDAPELGMEPEDAIMMAALDPHIARVLGLAWDDPVKLDGSEWSYKLVGRWKGPPVVVTFESLDALVTLSEAGVRVALDWEEVELVDGGIALRPSREEPLRLDFAEPKDTLVFELGAEEEGSPKMEGKRLS